MVMFINVSEQITEYPPDTDWGEKLYGTIMSHNHPIDEPTFSFSNANIPMFSHFNLITLRGCDEKYVYELSQKI